MSTVWSSASSCNETSLLEMGAAIQLMRPGVRCCPHGRGSIPCECWEACGTVGSPQVCSLIETAVECCSQKQQGVRIACVPGFRILCDASEREQLFAAWIVESSSLLCARETKHCPLLQIPGSESGNIAVAFVTQGASCCLRLQCDSNGMTFQEYQLSWRNPTVVKVAKEHSLVIEKVENGATLVLDFRPSR